MVDDDILFGPAEALLQGPVPTDDEVASAYHLFEVIRMIYGGFGDFDRMTLVHKKMLISALARLTKTGAQSYQTAAHRGLSIDVPEEVARSIREASIPVGF